MDVDWYWCDPRPVPRRPVCVGCNDSGWADAEWLTGPCDCQAGADRYPEGDPVRESWEAHRAVLHGPEVSGDAA